MRQKSHRRDTLLQNLSDIETATSDDDLKAKVEKAKQHLDSKQNKATHQPFDPNDLPTKNFGPIKDKPRKTKSEFTASALYDRPLAQFAALGDFKYDKLPGASDPVYLAETDEIVLTDAIKAKAAELNYDALAIYIWVRNNVEWLPTWGAIQSADHTLGSLKGNSLDISSLLIALYRASGIPARYVHGTLDVPMDKYMNWTGGFTNAEAALRFASSGGIPTEGVLTGGKLTTARMEHIWVEAAIDFEPSRGAKNKSADAWIAMDPSYKQYQFTTGIDVTSVTTVNMQTVADNYLASGTVNEQEGWISGFDPTILQNAQTQVQTDVETYLTNQTTPPTVSDVIGGHNAIIQSVKGFPASLPNKVVVKGATMDKLPSSLQHRITIQLGAVNDLFPNGKVTLPFAKVNNEKVTLSFRPATPDDEQVLLSLLPEGQITDVSQLPSSIPGYLIQVI